VHVCEPATKDIVFDKLREHSTNIISLL